MKRLGPEIYGAGDGTDPEDVGENSVSREVPIADVKKVAFEDLFRLGDIQRL